MGRCFCSYGRTTTWAMPRNMVNFIEPPPSHFHRQMLADTWAWPFFVHPIMQAQILVGEKCPQNWFIVTIEEGLLISLATPMRWPLRLCFGKKVFTILDLVRGNVGCCAVGHTGSAAIVGTATPGNFYPVV